MAHGDLRGLTRARVRQNYCPKCGAAPGEPCRGVGPDKRERVANHAERRAAAKVSRQRRAASYGRGGTDIWSGVVYALGYEAHADVQELRKRKDIAALESEIERAFAVLFILEFQDQPGKLRFGFPVQGDDGFVLVPQYSVGQYRVDFVFGDARKLTLRDCMAIELDGHEWHERTKEQAARDKARDRYLSRTFGRVIHFTGSEIYNDIGECFVEVARIFASLIGREADF